MTSDRMTIVAGHGDIGGGEQMLLRIAECARSLGWQVQVLGPSWGGLAEACAIRALDYAAPLGTGRRAYAVSAATYLGRPGQGLVWANGAFPAFLATVTPNRLVVHLHQQPSRSQSMALRGSVARAHSVLVPSASMSRAIRGSQVLLNWTEEIALVDRPGHSHDFTVAYLGRLSTDKGVDTLAMAVGAMARSTPNRRVRLLVGGDARFVPEESARAVERALAQCGAEVVRLGWVEPARVMATADVTVVPSRSSESFGLVAAEAMAIGCPLVVSDAGALPEVVGTSYPWVFPAGDADALKRLLEDVRRTEPSETVTQMRRRWEELFSPRAGRERLRVILAGLR